MKRTPEDSKGRRQAGAPLSAVTFDFTHTLAHAPRLAEIYAEVLRRHGIVAEPNDLRREILWVWRELGCRADPRRDRFAAHADGARGFWYRFLARVCERLEVDRPSRFAAAELFDRFARAEVWEVYPDVAPALAALRGRGLRIGLVSNFDHRLPRLLDGLGLAGSFEAVAYSSQCGCEKPHPRIFFACLEALDVPPERALHLGDSGLEDVEGAVAVGMRALRVDRSEPGSDLWRLIEPLLPPASGAAAPARRPGALESPRDADRHARS